MLSIGEFSNICKVSTKTLRYYAKIGLLLPNEINPENGYRYYSIEQLETMLFINRLKSYQFSLEEIKDVLKEEKSLYTTLSKKREHILKQAKTLAASLQLLDDDMLSLKQGKSIMSYLDTIDVQLVEETTLHILTIRKMVHKYEYAKEYGFCFKMLLEQIKENTLTITSPPMVLFHNETFSELGLDTEFAIPIQECVTGTRDFKPGLCLKTVLRGAYTNLPSIYTKQIEWAKEHGYQNNGPLYEVYVTDPSAVLSEEDLVTEIYYPVIKNDK